MQLWVSEHEISGHIRYDYKVKQQLFSGQSDFQKIDIVETEAFGRMLLIDGCIMLTDYDEFVYHELITHVPACRLRELKRVVVIGGGDGGTVRELLRYPGIEEIVLCEIDEMVIDACKEFFPRVAGGLDDPRVKVFIGDGVLYMREHARECLDLVIVDSTDPIGPGEGLFSGDFYQSVAKALKSSGLMVCQSESPWFDDQVIRRIMNNVRAGFLHIHPYVGAVPTYPRGFWSWTIGAKSEFELESYDVEKFNQIALDLKYLNNQMMASVFAVPQFVVDKFLGNYSA